MLHGQSRTHPEVQTDSTSASACARLAGLRADFRDPKLPKQLWDELCRLCRRMGSE